MAKLLNTADPVWQQVVEYETTIPQLKILAFVRRLTETRVFVEHLLRSHSENKDALLAQMMSGAAT